MNRLNLRTSALALGRHAAITSAILLFAGAAAGQTGWTLESPNTSPSARSSAAFAYDAARQRVVMFGGFGAAGHLDDTWEWDGIGWRSVATSSAPSPRGQMAFAYDAARGVCVLHGGRGPDTQLGDTWTWDGTAWQQATPTSSPQPRLWHDMVYDAARERVVLFGGFSEPGTYRPDTWEWDGTDWTQVIPTAQPPARGHHALAYDPELQSVVMLGGHSNGPRFADMWSYDGSTWTLLTSATAVGPIADPALVHDPRRGSLVLFGGWELGFKAQTWEWTAGEGWRTLASHGGAPAARANTRAVNDAARDELLFFGGLGVPGSLGDTWSGRFAPAVTASFGVGCPGTDGIPTLVASPGTAPRLGATLGLDATGLPQAEASFLQVGLSMHVWNALSLPLALGPLGGGSCTLFVSGEALLDLPATAGVGRQDIVIPANGRLAGATIFAQVLALDSLANDLGLVTSNALQIDLGI